MQAARARNALAGVGRALKALMRLLERLRAASADLAIPKLSLSQFVSFGALAAQTHGKLVS